MRVLIDRFWNEPAFCISVLTGLATAVVIVLIKVLDGQPIDGAAIGEIAVALGIPVGGGAATRHVVKPTRRRDG